MLLHIYFFNNHIITVLPINKINKVVDFKINKTAKSSVEKTCYFNLLEQKSTSTSGAMSNTGLLQVLKSGKPSTLKKKKKKKVIYLCYTCLWVWVQVHVFECSMYIHVCLHTMLC